MVDNICELDNNNVPQSIQFFKKKIGTLPMSSRYLATVEHHHGVSAYFTRLLGVKNSEARASLQHGLVLHSDGNL